MTQASLSQQDSGETVQPHVRQGSEASKRACVGKAAGSGCAVGAHRQVSLRAQMSGGILPLSLLLDTMSSLSDGARLSWGCCEEKASREPQSRSTGVLGGDTQLRLM